MIHKTNKGYYEIRFKWRKSIRYISMGCICKMHLNAANKYQDKINQIRQECKRTRQPLPIDLPKPEKIPSLGKIIEKHKSLTEYGESDLLSQIIIYAREHNMNQDEYLKLVELNMANYRRQVAEQEAKKAAALAKRRETLAKRPN